jgi:hypothetical protein
VTVLSDVKILLATRVQESERHTAEIVALSSALTAIDTCLTAERDNALALVASVQGALTQAEVNLAAATEANRSLAEELHLERQQRTVIEV